tara:strand:+ start:314 stop:1498 length:1185 start_codon:yes stop_codon:yes gene_type:complete
MNINLFKDYLSLPDFKKIDYVFLSLFIFLCLFGLISIATASIQFSDSLTGEPLDFFYKQFLHLVVGFTLFAFLLTIPLAFWESFDLVLFVLGIFLLILVFLPGIGLEVKGAYRWLRIGPIGLQPSEIIKFLTLIYISGYSVRRLKDLRPHWFAFLKPAILVVLVSALILRQPDLGTSAVIFATVLGMLFVAGVQLKQFLFVIALGIIGIFALIFFEPYRWDRIMAYQDPWSSENVFHGGYQLTQSLMAIGRGDWFGVGLGEGLMKLGYLPDAHTDFIFAVIVEEMGLLTAIVIIATLFFLCFRCINIGNKAFLRSLHFGYFFCYGVAILIGLQTFINVGVATGLLPTKGLTLPFISYGGTNLIIMCSLSALVLRVDLEVKSSQPIVNIRRRVSF